jgi:hypothetical protein
MVAGVQQAEERGVVALGAAAGEDDLCRMAAEELGECLAGLRAHGLHHLGQQRGGGIGVHIDSAHGVVLLIFIVRRVWLWR